MTNSEPSSERDEVAPPVGGSRPVTPFEAAEAEGGDPVCWLQLVCAECGSVTAEGHRASCSQAEPTNG